MKLNPSCIRAILLTLEDKCDFNTPWEYNRYNLDSDFLADYNHAEIIYHISQAEQSDLIKNVQYYSDGDSALIDDLTPAGHEFLSNICCEPVWKKILEKGANASLPILIELAKEIAFKHFLD